MFSYRVRILSGLLRSGRSFLCQMLDFLHSHLNPSLGRTPICLNKWFRSDLAWWQPFLHHWNGISFLLPPSHLPQMELTMNASGSWRDWSMAPDLLVPNPIGPVFSKPFYCSKRADSNYPCMPYMGWSLAWPAGPLPL